MQSATNSRVVPGQIGVVLDEVRRLTVALQGVKSVMRQVHPDRASYVLLLSLAHEGPSRAADLARHHHSDPSTVSRHISELVSSGLVQRIAHQDDGRACLLELTDDGHEKASELMALRNSAFALAVDGWSPKDVGRLGELLGRFNDDLTERRNDIVAAICNGRGSEEGSN